MSSDYNPGNTALKSYMQCHADGLWDIYIGIALLCFGLLLFFDRSAMVGIIVPIMLPFVFMAKKSFTRARLGNMAVSPERRSREQTARMGMFFLGIVTLALGVFVAMAFTSDSGALNWVRQLELIPLGFVLALTLGAFGLFLGIKRYMAYAVIFLGVFIAARFLHTDYRVIFVSLGALLIISGILVMVSFMRKYPRVETAEGYRPIE